MADTKEQIWKQRRDESLASKRLGAERYGEPEAQAKVAAGGYRVDSERSARDAHAVQVCLASRPGAVSALELSAELGWAKARVNVALYSAERAGACASDGGRPPRWSATGAAAGVKIKSEPAAEDTRACAVPGASAQLPAYRMSCPDLVGFTWYSDIVANRRERCAKGDGSRSAGVETLVSLYGMTETEAHNIYEHSLVGAPENLSVRWHTALEDWSSSLHESAGHAAHGRPIKQENCDVVDTIQKQNIENQGRPGNRNTKRQAPKDTNEKCRPKRKWSTGEDAKLASAFGQQNKIEGRLRGFRNGHGSVYCATASANMHACIAAFL
eukprot:SAG31_NODE_5526_length_2478_cov_1.484237_2_plen_327_part_00